MSEGKLHMGFSLDIVDIPLNHVLWVWLSAGSRTDLVPNLIWVVINILHGQYNQYYSRI